MQDPVVSLTRMRRLPILALLLIGALVNSPAAEANKWWFGGGLGLGFGDRDYVELNGIVGYRATPRFTPGLRLTYRSREETRGGSNIDTNDYGASLFARYRVWKPVYAQAEYEYLSYEFVLPDRTRERETFGSVLGGFGASFPLSERLGVFATALYNFSYDSDDIRNPYSGPWIFRAGVGYSF